MKMPPAHLRQANRRAASQSEASLSGVGARVALRDLADRTSLGGRLHELAGRSVLLATHEQLSTAIALIELDGIARRIVVCPPDIPATQFPWIAARAEIDAIVSDYEIPAAGLPADLLRVPCGAELTLLEPQNEAHDTEWVLLTSGTSGRPKMIVHSLASLCAATRPPQSADPVVWGVFYDIRRYGGLSVFFRAVLGGASLVLSSAHEPIAGHLARLGAHGVTHLLGTPSHWRRALMSPRIRDIAPAYVRLSGEIADQPILNALRANFPGVPVAHAFATTEAGVAFEVTDGLAGFPSTFLGIRGEVEMKIENDTLRIRSNRTASRYLDGENGPLADADGFVDTGDVIEQRGDRCFFLGRRNGVINVGGFKVYPEEVEAVINRHPAVRMSVVGPRRNPITGSLVAAEVVLAEAPDPSGITGEILEMCRQQLAPHKIPATIRCVPALDLAPAGKLGRSRA